MSPGGGNSGWISVEEECTRSLALVELQAHGCVPPRNVVEILHCSQHLVEEFLATFVTQMKSAKIGDKVLLVPATLRINSGELGPCVFLRILGYPTRVFIAFSGRSLGEWRGEGEEDVGGKKSFQKREKKKHQKSLEKLFVGSWVGGLWYFRRLYSSPLSCFGALNTVNNYG